MNFVKCLWRTTGSVRPVLPRMFMTTANPIQTQKSARPPSTQDSAIPTPSQTSVQSQAVPAQTTTDAVELDKLYKRVELEMRGLDPAVLLSYSWFCVAAASHLGIEVTKNWSYKKAEKERFTLLKAAFGQKRCRVQYEIRTYFRFIHFQRLTGSTCDTYLEYIERNLPEGCALKVTKVECLPMPEHITPHTNETN